MNLKDKINEDLKTAMKQQNKNKLNTVRSIRALILEFEKSGANKTLTSEDEVKLLSGAVKKRKESIEQFQNAGRQDLVDKEQAELNILMTYLPKQLSENEILNEVKRIAGGIGAKIKEDFPKLMPVVVKELKGKAEGKTIKNVVEKFLDSN
jgi:uncharacterized protein